MKKIVALLSVLIICLFTTIPAFAADSSVIYNNASQFVFNPEGGNLFQKFKGVMPGDKMTQNIVIKNTKIEYPITVYLRAEIADEYKDFLNYIDLTVYYSATKDGLKTVLQSGLASETGNLTNDVKLGTYKPNEQGYITVEIYMHKELDNTYRNYIGKIKWIFSVEEGERIVTPTKPSNQPTTRPHGFIPGIQDSPFTGVEFTIGIIAICVIIVAVIVLIMANKKERKESNIEKESEKNET